MPSPLDPAKREAILDDIRTAAETGTARNEIARRHQVSPSTVSKIADEEGLGDAFDRSHTKNATEAKVADNRSVRVELSRRLLAKAGDLLDAMDEPAIVFNIGGKDNVYTEHRMPKPPTADLRNLMVTAATAIDKHIVIDRHDSGAGLDETVSLLDRIWDGLKAKHGDGPEEDTAGDDG